MRCVSGGKGSVRDRQRPVSAADTLALLAVGGKRRVPGTHGARAAAHVLGVGVGEIDGRREGHWRQAASGGSAAGGRSVGGVSGGRSDGGVSAGGGSG